MISADESRVLHHEFMSILNNKMNLKLTPKTSRKHPFSPDGSVQTLDLLPQAVHLLLELLPLLPQLPDILRPLLQHGRLAQLQETVKDES